MPRTFHVDGSERIEAAVCCHVADWTTGRHCNAPGEYWYPAAADGIAVLCLEHGAKFFPGGAQRIDDTTWHGGGEPIDG